MATGKRYYWIKLKDTFMASDTIDYLMSLTNGANYVVLYQMLCLKTINTGGRLTLRIGEIIIPFDIEKIHRDCKWFSIDTIRIALSLYKQLGLIYEEYDGTLIIANHSEMVGTETDYSAQKRIQRNSRKCLTANAVDSTVDSPADKAVDNVHTDIRDKRLDIRDKKIDDDDNIVIAANTRETLDREVTPKGETDEDLSKIISVFEIEIGAFPHSALDALMEWRKHFPDDLIILAINYAAQSGVRNWRYINGIMETWRTDGIKTVGDAKSREQKRKNDRLKSDRRRKSCQEDDLSDVF